MGFEDILREAAPLGVGGVVAVIIFLIYRKDSIQWQEAWKGQTQILLQVVKENTVAVTALVEKLENVEQASRRGRDR